MKYALLTGLFLALGSVELWAQAIGVLMVLVSTNYIEVEQ